MALICFTQQARDVDSTSIQCLFKVYDTGQSLAERLVFAVYRAGIHEILSGLSHMLNRPYKWHCHVDSSSVTQSITLCQVCCHINNISIQTYLTLLHIFTTPVAHVQISLCSVNCVNGSCILLCTAF